MVTDNATVPIVRMRENAWNICIRSGGGGIIYEGLETSYVSAHERELGGSKGSVVRTLVGLSVGETYVTALVQE